jgi:hypothetical protein
MKTTKMMILAMAVVLTAAGCDPYVAPQEFLDCQGLDEERTLFVVSPGTQVPIQERWHVLGVLRDGSVLINVVERGLDPSSPFPGCEVVLLVSDQEAAGDLVIDTIPDDVGGTCIVVAGGASYHGYDPELSPENTYVVDCTADPATDGGDEDEDEDEEEEESWE